MKKITKLFLHIAFETIVIQHHFLNAPMPTFSHQKIKNSDDEKVFFDSMIIL